MSTRAKTQRLPSLASSESTQAYLRASRCTSRPEAVSDAPLARRHRLFAAIIIEAALRLAAEPAGLDIFHQQRARPVLRIRQAFIEHLHHRQTGIEADEVGELERPHRMVGAEPHR